MVVDWAAEKLLETCPHRAFRPVQLRRCKRNTRDERKGRRESFKMTFFHAVPHLFNNLFDLAE